MLCFVHLFIILQNELEYIFLYPCLTLLIFPIPGWIDPTPNGGIMVYSVFPAQLQKL